jgi:cysteine desulfurase
MAGKGKCMKRVYFDHAATTPTRPEVVEAMLPYYRDNWGNPSSLHGEGIAALEGLERAREHVAGLLGAMPDEIVFTGSGTEADNHALVGAAHALRAKGDHIITSAIEHHAVHHTASHLESLGVRVTYLPVDATGLVDPQDVGAAITDRTILVSIMHANNEVGTVEPIAEIGAVCRELGVLFHTDAVQTVGHLPIDVHQMNVDMLSLSAHKLYGPKGIGALFIRKGVALTSYVHGGGQERGRRASTENVAGAVALGEAARLAREEMTQEAAHNAALRDRIIGGILERVPGAVLTGHQTRRLGNSASFCIPGVEGEELLLDLDQDGFAVSSGSACNSGVSEPSLVLLALGIPPEIARGSVRITVGRGNTEDEVEHFLDVLPKVVQRLRQAPSRLAAPGGRTRNG